MENHNSWLKELIASGKHYSYDEVVERALQDNSSEDQGAFNAQLLLAFTYTEYGKYEDASCYIGKAKDQINKAPNRFAKQGYEYLVNNIRNSLREKKGEAGEVIVISKFKELGKKGQAVVYGCKGYTMSIWDPETLADSMVYAFKKACWFDPKNCYYLIGYAMALGRQRRQLASSNRMDEDTSLSRLGEEKNLWKDCIRLGGVNEKPKGMTFIAFLNSEMICFSDLPHRIKSTLLQEIFDNLDGIMEELNNVTVPYSKFTIAKRAAMCYYRVMNYSREKESHCCHRAEELFNYALKLGKDQKSKGLHFCTTHVLNEFGKFLVRTGKFNEAKEMLKEAWVKHNFGEALLIYIRCCRKMSLEYNPLSDIEEGLSKRQEQKYKVYLLCLKGEYLLKNNCFIKESINAWMDALLLDPEGTYMRGVPQQFTSWPSKTNFPFLKASGRFIDYIQALEEHLLFLAGPGHGDGEELLWSLRKLREYYGVKRPRELEKTQKTIKMAMAVSDDEKLETELKKELVEVESLIGRINEGISALSIGHGSK